MKFASAILVSFSLATAAFGYVASSEGYRIEMDSISIAGATSSSASYLLQDTISQSASGTSTSASYTINAGYQAMRQDDTLTITLPGTIRIATTSVDGGAIFGSVSATWTISSDGGYQFYLKANNSPAMQSVDAGGTINNATINGGAGNGPGSWEATSVEFAFSPFGLDLAGSWAGLGSGGDACPSSVVVAKDSECWAPFSTSNRLIANRSAAASSRTISLILAVSSADTPPNDSEGNYQAALTVSIIGL